MGNKKRPNGPMVPITDGDIENLVFIKDAAKTYGKMSEWTGFSQSALSRWMTGSEFEMEWRKSVKKKIAKVRRDLDPKPMMAEVRVPVFGGEITVVEDPTWLSEMIELRDALNTVIAMVQGKVL